jgi:hypothetical protein
MLRLRLLALAGAVSALLKAPALAEPPAFAEVGVAFLEKHCTDCHGADKSKADLALHQVRDDASMLRMRKRWKEVLEMVRSGEMPPDDRPQPTAEERRLFLESAAAVSAKVMSGRPDPGRATLRRLNRTEYNNTIRDLLQVEFRPADDFPSDDVGYGFDNIADVLSVSPVLMERYLDAAEKIAAEAIPLNPAAPPKRTMAGKYLEPASRDVPQDRFRPINAREKEAIRSGPLHTPATIKPDGEHVMRARLYAKSGNGKPVPVALLAVGEKLANAASAAELSKLDGAAMEAFMSARILKIAEVSARDEQQAQVLQVKIPATAGIDRIALAALKPAAGQPTPSLFVEYLECEGPFDTRSAATKALMVFSPNRPQREQAQEVLWRFASRAWRRPVTKSEMEGLLRLFDYTVGHGESWEEGLRRSVAAVLASPKFIFRLEPDAEPENPEPHAITELQLATRLSYFLWSSTPDDELLQLASLGELTANLDAQIRRMLKDPRAAALVDNFALQWLQLGRLAGHSADKQTFARWRPTLRASMLEETRRFCLEALREDRSILDLLDADFTWVDRRLAEIYGLKVPGGFQGDEWKRVSLAGTGRGGLLTQASILTVTSNPTRTSPVKRGKWVLEQLLGAPPPPPPADIPSLDDTQRKELKGTFRQKLEQHRADPACANCHVKMDAFGFALENFDGVGQWRERDESGARIDPRGDLGKGRSLKGASDLQALLRGSREEFARCLAEKMLIYALGRGADYYDEPAIDRIHAALAQHGYRFSTLITGIVKSVPFRMRRGTSQLDETPPNTTAQR